MSRFGLLLGLFAAMACSEPAIAQQSFATDSKQAFASGNIFAPPSVQPAQVIGANADGGLLPPAAPPPKVWSGSAEAGLNGASGNSDLFNLRANFLAQRKTSDNIFTTDFLYTYTQQNKITTVQQAILNTRDEILFAGSPWSLFGAGQLEYDELRAYKFRIGIYAGVGYTVIDDDTTTFKLRAGAGATREVGSGGLASRWVPEMVFGYDFRYKINDRSSFLSILDFYPRTDHFSQFRVRLRAAYEYVLDPATGTVLRVGIQDRYDSDPGTAKKNDLTYFATLGIKF